MARFQKFRIAANGEAIIINLDQVMYFMREADSPNGDQNETGSIAAFSDAGIRYRLADTLEEIEVQLEALCKS